MLARTRQMADFGDAVPNCPGAEPARRWRLLPAPGCRPGYEEWDTALDVGRRVRRAARLRHPQRDHPVRPREPRRGDLQQASRSAGSRPGGVGVPLQGRPPQRAAPALVRAQRRPLALPHRRLRPPRRRRPASGRLAPRPRRPAARARRRRERVHRRAALGRRHLPRRPRPPPAARASSSRVTA